MQQFNERNRIENKFYRDRERINAKRRELVMPYCEEGVSLMDELRGKLIKRYVCELPPFRTRPGSKDDELPVRGYRETDLGLYYMTVKTNPPEIFQTQTILTKNRGKVTNAQNISELHQILDEIQKQLDSIDFEPHDLEVVEEDFETLQKSDLLNYKETAYIFGNAIVNPKLNKSGQSLADEDVHAALFKF